MEVIMQNLIKFNCMVTVLNFSFKFSQCIFLQNHSDSGKMSCGACFKIEDKPRIIAQKELLLRLMHLETNYSNQKPWNDQIAIVRAIEQLLKLSIISSLGHVFSPLIALLTNSIGFGLGMSSFN